MTDKPTTLAELVALALSRTSGNKVFLDFAKVSPKVAEQVLQATGLDVRDWVHSIDESALRHIFNRHGSAQTEEPRGQLAVEIADIARLTEVVLQPDAIVPTHPLPDGTPMVIFKKRVAHDVVFVQEMRVGRKKLTAKTLWKIRLMPPPDEAETPP